MQRRTKIVATIGPASRNPEVLARMVEAGLDVARLNFSHGTAEEHAETARLVRDAAGDASRLYITYMGLADTVEDDEIMYLADGAVRLRVTAVRAGDGEIDA